MAAEHTVVSHDAWIEARKAFLVREKEFARQREALARDRRDSGTVRGLRPAHRLPFHVPAGLGRGMPALLVLGG